MNPISRESFVQQFSGGIDVKTLDADTRTALARAGVGEKQLTDVAGRDGVIGTRTELERLFALIDRVDHNGSYRSIDTSQRACGGKEVATLSGAAYQALKKELDERRTCARLGGQAGEPRSISPESTVSKKDIPFVLTPTDAAWMRKAAVEIGTQELEAVEEANPRILDYFRATWQPHTDDSGKKNAWCAAFVTWTLTQANVPNSKTVGARGYETFGEPCEPFSRRHRRAQGQAWRAETRGLHRWRRQSRRLRVSGGQSG